MSTRAQSYEFIKLTGHVKSSSWEKNDGVQTAGIRVTSWEIRFH